MKKILFSALLLLLNLTVKAQTEKGRSTIGVSVGSFTYQSANQGHSFSASLNPSAGHFVASNFLVGIGLPISLSSSKYTYPVGNLLNRNTTLGLSPFLRYYFGASSWKPFVGLALTYEHFNARNEGSSNQVSTTKGNTGQATPAVGLAYFINRSVALNAQLGYNWAITKAVSSDNYGNVYDNDSPAYTNANATLAIGFSIFFGK